MTQDYPMMIYHIAEKPKIINTLGELETHLADGWLQRPFEHTPKVILQRKIAFHKAEIEKLGILLSKMSDTKEPATETQPTSEPEAKPENGKRDTKAKKKIAKR